MNSQIIDIKLKAMVYMINFVTVTAKNFSVQTSHGNL